MSYIKEIRRFDALLPIEAAVPPPSTWYTEQEIYDVELREVFEKCWIPVGRLDQVKNVGDYFTGDIVGNPYVVVRGEGGVLEAFHNVCRHKGAEIALKSGNCSQFVCPYHGWTYSLGGCLKKAPHLGAQESFKIEREGLKRIAIDTWGPFIFLDLDAYWGGGNRTRELRKDIAEIAPPLEAVGLSNLKWVARKTFDMQCNWKVFVENSLDGGYHVDYAHESLAKGLEFSGYKTEIFERSSIQTCGTQGTDKRLGDQVMYAWLFPNFFVNRYGKMMDTNIVIPTSPNSCQVIFDFYFDYENLNEWSVKKEMAVAIKHSEGVQEEDITVCESTQRGMRSMSFQHGRYSSKMEKAVHAFHVLLSRELEKRGN